MKMMPVSVHFDKVVDGSYVCRRVELSKKELSND
jgi:hypothetical protein